MIVIITKILTTKKIIRNYSRVVGGFRVEVVGSFGSQGCGLGSFVFSRPPQTFKTEGF